MDEPSHDSDILPAARPRLLRERAGRQELGGIGKTLFWSLIKEKKLDVVRIGRRTFVTSESIDRLIENGKPQRNAMEIADHAA